MDADHERQARRWRRTPTARRRSRPARKKPNARPAMNGPSALPRSARRPRRRSRCRSGPTSPPMSRYRCRRSGAPGSSRGLRSPTTQACSTSVRCSSASGVCAGSRGGEGPVVRGTGGIRRPPAAAVLAGPAVHRRHPGQRRGGVRVFPGGVRGRRCHRADRAATRCARTIPVHLPAPAARPLPVHRRLHPVARAGGRDRAG